MKSSIQKIISEMLVKEKQGGLPHAMLDLLRVLVLYNGAVWKSELIQELALLREARRESGVFAEGEIDKVINELGEEGLITIEEMIRCTLQSKEGAKDTLLSLVDLRATSTALSEDKVLASRRCR